MSAISPTRVSIYDFLYHDTQPIVSLLADATQLSIPQARMAMISSLQAIISALLTYQVQHKAQAISKKLFASSAVKELRQYNAMSFTTISISLHNRNDMTDVLFGNMESVINISALIALQIEATMTQAKTLLSSLCVIVLRELAILTDYSQLDNNEIDEWFVLQPQFLHRARFTTTTSASMTTSPDKEMTLLAQPYDKTPPLFDYYWFKATGFESEYDFTDQNIQQSGQNHLEAIGRAPENDQQDPDNDPLMFAPMPTITLPHQHWLLQLAKVSDIYLSRERLRISSEPDSLPVRPFINLGFIRNDKKDTSAITENKAISFNQPLPLWKNPVIFIIIFVIGGLGGLAALKYQTQKGNGVPLAKEAVYEHDHAEEIQQQKDRESKAKSSE